MSTDVRFKIPGKGINNASSRLFAMSCASNAITPKNLNISLSRMANESMRFNGLPTSARRKNSIAITKEIDAASPQFFNARNSQEVLNVVDIGLVQPNPKGGEKVVATIHLTNAAIVNYTRYSPRLTPHGHGPSGSQSPHSNELEEIELAFQRISFQATGGSTSTGDDWGKP
jgi:type VI secretion system Hcp family effector